MAVYFAAIKPGDKILTMNLAHGGHLTHGHPANFSGKFYQVTHYGVDAQTEQSNRGYSAATDILRQMNIRAPFDGVVYSLPVHQGAYVNPGDLVLTMSVSGNSPNLVNAIDWAKKNGLHTVALVGGKRGRLAELAEQVIVVNDTHYGRVEDAHMGICHMLCYAFMENTELGK